MCPRRPPPTPDPSPPPPPPSSGGRGGGLLENPKGGGGGFQERGGGEGQGTRCVRGIWGGRGGRGPIYRENEPLFRRKRLTEDWDPDCLAQGLNSRISAKSIGEGASSQPAPKYHTKGCSRSFADSPGARTLVFAAFEPFHSCEFRASIARTPFRAILWRSPK